MDPNTLDGLAAQIDGLVEHFATVADQLDEAAGHVLGLRSEVDSAQEIHGHNYDDNDSDTGNETRGQLDEVKSAVDEAHGQVAGAKDSMHDEANRLTRVAQDIRDHAGRIRAALGA